LPFLGADETIGQHAGGALGLDGGQLRPGLRLIQLRLRHLEGNFVGPRVDGDEPVPGANVPALAKMNAHERAHDPRADGNGAVGLHGADGAEHHRDILPRGLGDENGSDLAPGSALVLALGSARGQKWDES
jgi:hypothetical protein